jgi:hypothetical protein
MTLTTVTLTTEIELDVSVAAKWFCGLDDEQQAQFLIEVEKVSRESMAGKAGVQWLYMMGHLIDCKCSNDQTRDMIREWASYLEAA